MREGDTLPGSVAGAVTRRDCFVGAIATLGAAQVANTANAERVLLSKSEFALRGINLNGAGHHPMPLSTARALKQYADARARGAFKPAVEGASAQRRALNAFASLINASTGELMFVPSTTYAENMLVAALELRERRARVVSDVLHFKSSLYQYSCLARDGLDFVLVPMRNHRIDLDDLDRAITPGTAFVSVSMVSYVNGFAHDLKALCALAHERGALVYVDAAQAAGAVELDVKALGVDFCACPGFKWLMAESGAGFLYARRDLLPHLKRVLPGYHQLERFTYHVFPHDSAAEQPFDFQAEEGLNGRLAIGSVSNAGIVALAQSLELIRNTGVGAIQKHREPLLRRLESALSAEGIQSLTPSGSTSPIATYVYPDAERRLRPALERAAINIELYPHRIRVSPSVYNDMGDIECLIGILLRHRQ